jgi:hypothetical protein
MYNILPHSHTIHSEFTSLLAYKGASSMSTDTTLWHQRLGHPGRDTMTLALRSSDINGAKYDSHVPLLPCEPHILAKLHHASVNTQHGTKATACFQAFNSNIFAPVKETTGPGGAKYLLGVIDHYSNYIWLLTLSSKKVVVARLSSVLTDIWNLHARLHRACAFNHLRM